jgi:putative hydrolase of the HAD superfamily
MIKDVKAVIFDIDDTLFDRNRAQREIIHIMIREFPEIFTGLNAENVIDAFYKSDDAGMREYYSGGSADSVRAGRSRAFLKILGLNEDHAGEITRVYLDVYPTIKLPIDDAESVVNDLSERFQLGIISNGFPDVQYNKLKTLGIEDKFDCILLSEELGIRKPDPEIFWKAANLLAKNPEECIHIGDSYNADAVGSKKAGMLACWFNPNKILMPEANFKPDFEIRRLNELLRILNF